MAADGVAETIPLTLTPFPNPTLLLCSEITVPGVETVKREFLHALWPAPTDQNITHVASRRVEAFTSYLKHIKNDVHSLTGQDIAFKTFDDAFKLLELIQINSAQSLSDILGAIRAAASHPNLTSADEDKLITSIEYVIRWWLITNITITKDETPQRPGRQALGLRGQAVRWSKTQTLLEAFECSIGRPTDPLNTSSVAPAEFSEFLNVVHMRRIAGFKVVWTRNLAQHLTMQGKHFYLFAEVAALKTLAASGPSKKVLPKGLIEETLQTLDLLIPLDSPACDKWILKEIRKHGLDPELRRPKDRPNREPEVYHYWRERLVRLSDAFEKTKPQSPIGWLYDRRDMGQWWNYWLIFATLALTVIFGLLQSIASIEQAWGESSKD